MLLPQFLSISADWRRAFPQQRTHRRAVRQGLGGLVCLGRRTLSRIIWTNGGEQNSWSADYFLHERCKWRPQELFAPVWKRALGFCRSRLVGVAIDDTRLRKTGRRIKQAFYQHDPLSPPFHANLMLGLRYLQASLLVPFDRGGKTGARALPVRFECAPVPKRPGKRAGDAEREQYEQARKRCRISQRLVDMMAPLRAALDAAGGIAKKMVLSLDGSFSNRTVFLAPRDRTELIARTRLDAVLCKAAPTGSRRFYGVEKFRPEQVRRDETIVWKTTKLFYGGKRRKIRYKEVNEVYWQGGARRTPLRLLVVAPTPYSKRLSSKMYYRQPAYLLTTDLASQARELLQIYFDRWQIEVNHREEKDTLGVGQAQLWSETAVPKQPVLAVAAYSALLLASLLAYGPGRGEAYAPLPKWRKRQRGLLVWIWWRCCGKKWSKTPICWLRWGSNPPGRPSAPPLTGKICRNSSPRDESRGYDCFGWPAPAPHVGVRSDKCLTIAVTPFAHIYVAHPLTMSYCLEATTYNTCAWLSLPRHNTTIRRYRRRSSACTTCIDAPV